MNDTSSKFARISLDALHLDTFTEKLDAFAAVSAVKSKGALLPLLITASLLFLILIFSSSLEVDAPVVGYRSLFEPTLLLRSRFLFGARDIIQNGYKKYKNAIFYIRRIDIDVAVVPTKYLDELRLVPNSKLSSLHALVANLVGDYTYISRIFESDQHFRVIQTHLQGNLEKFLGWAQEELNDIFETDVPNSNEWQEVDIQDLQRKIVSRVMSRIFLGYPACRNQEWLHLCLAFTVNVFATSFVLRMFPPFLHPLIAYLLPSRYWIRNNLNKAEGIIVQLIQNHAERTAQKTKEPRTNQEDEIASLLDWMIENAKGNEAEPHRLAARQLILTLASVHTTSMALSNALFDLCAHPEYMEPLREEILDISQQPGGLCKRNLEKMHKMESFLTESQRLNPPVLLTPQRQVMQHIQLSDGTVLPKGTRIAFASASIAMDPMINPSPEQFDGFRSFYKRQRDLESLAAAGQESSAAAALAKNRNAMAFPDKDRLVFGHGRQACPGRFFAVSEMKLILARFLVGYDFKFLPGKSRPRNFFLEEYILPDPRAKLMMRTRRL
ncbi:putative cytochrome P450 [Corynespora cassiicola Philippines]|uniref:Putative cytochrome P450 n=1 Tax=Corynespora cassiicola Philippines TaxID=1448308 RepID=A0A2T2NCZ9_CORCC|nr:putative cytochrome P450 [Corynespora cassiicola Philippines]